jgi:uncharacterized protein
MEDGSMNNKTISGMKCMLYLFGLLAVALPAQAASFDCAKAGTKVEKFICGDAEISKLDEELNAAYKTAVQDEKQADTIKQAQKQWMKERNGCADAECVKSGYRKRIEQLHPSQNAAPQAQAAAAPPPQVAQSGVANADATASAKKYPPYPDVWEWVAPEHMRAGVGIDLWTLPNGDVLINYADLDNPRDNHNVTFFSHETFRQAEQALGTYRPSEEKAKIPYGEGRTLQVLGCLGCRSGGCYNGLDGRLAIRSAANKSEERKTLLYLSDQPQHYKTQKHCLDGKDFDYWVDAVFPEFMPLADGTFLLVDLHGLIVRFDQNLKTKSSLINTRLFWMDAEELEKFQAKYGDRADGDKNLKQLQRDLHRLILERKKGEQK